MLELQEAPKPTPGEEEALVAVGRARGKVVLAVSAGRCPNVMNHVSSIAGRIHSSARFCRAILWIAAYCQFAEPQLLVPIETRRIQQFARHSDSGRLRPQRLVKTRCARPR